MAQRRLLFAFLWMALALALLGLGMNLMLLFDDGKGRMDLREGSWDGELRHRLEGHVRRLASDIGERNLRHRRNLLAAAAYIQTVWEEQGYRVEKQQFTVGSEQVSNLEVAVAGRNQAESVVVGAHYDSAPGTPGANDNASGVAALLELSRYFAGKTGRRNLRFVAFVNEEPPYYYTRYMGSRVYAGRARARGENIVAMLSLETIGYYSDAPGSQRYPFPFGLFYPNTADFIGFVSNLGSRRLVKEALHAFRRHSSLPAHGLAAPGLMTGVGWSDHWSFWQEGYSAIMVTDTALFRYGAYHEPGDTPEKLVYDTMAEAVAGLAGCIGELVGGPGE